MTYSELVKARYSCRKFSAKPVESEKLTAIINAGISAPTAKNAQPVKIWFMQSAEAREKVCSCTPFTWMKDVPAVFVIGGTKEGAFLRPSDERSFGDVDAAIVATHMMLAVEAEGLGTTWVGYFDVPKMKELFPAMKDYDLVAVFPVGYPSEDAAPSDRHYIRKELADMVSVL